MKIDDKCNYDIPIIPTGSLSLNLALGIGGYPRGRIIEILGMESAGKTTLTLTAIREAQKLGGKVAFIDAEHAFDVNYAKTIGIEVKDLLISQPETGEEHAPVRHQFARLLPQLRLDQPGDVDRERRQRREELVELAWSQEHVQEEAVAEHHLREVEWRGDDRKRKGEPGGQSIDGAAQRGEHPVEYGSRHGGRIGAGGR